MLEKLLPILKSLPIKLQQLLQRPKKEPKEEQQNQSPNLLSQYSSSSSDITAALEEFKNYPLKLVGYFQKMIIAVQLAFLVVFCLNFWQDRLLETVKAENARLDAQIRSYGNTVKDADTLIKRIDRYKKLTNSRKPLSDRLKFISDNSSVVKLKNIKITQEGVSITAEAASPLSFALLISDYFKNKDVSAVVLKSASLNPNINAFYVALDVVFK